MNCRNCGHGLQDHDWTLHLCAGEVFGSTIPRATKCFKECRSYEEMRAGDGCDQN